jgi:hypothetical protein
MAKVTMNLTDPDIENTDEIYCATGARSKAHAVSIALSLTRFIIDALRQPGTQLLIRDAQGNCERIVMPELQRLSKRPPVHSDVARADA